MRHTRRSILIAFTIVGAALGTSDVDDGLLHDRITRKLNNNPSLRIRDLQVEVVDGVVTIRGIVRSKGIRKRAAKMASVKGVKTVVNKLVVGN